MVFLFVASHSTDLVLPCKKDTLCFIENVSFSVPLVTKCFQEIKFILSLSEILAKVAFYQEKPKVELTG